MSKYKDIAGFFQERGPEDIERFIDKNLDISRQVYSLLEERGWSQKDLAISLEKTDAEVSKWLSGSHNLTLRSIAKLEAALGTDIILTPQKASSHHKYIQFTVRRAEYQQFHENLGYSPLSPEQKSPVEGTHKMKIA